MKKLLYSSMVLTIFSVSIILFQISCQDEADAAGPATTAANRFLYLYAVENNDTGEAVTEFWTANNDGTDKKKIPIVLPAGLALGDEGMLTPDGLSLIFSVNADPDVEGINYIYSISIDGTNLKKVVDVQTPTPGYDSYYQVLQTY